MTTNEMVLSGREFQGEDFYGSFAEFLIPRMKSLPGDSIKQVDGKTGESITCRDFLKLSLEIAEGLIKLGVCPGDVVVHAVPNSIRSHATIMGAFFSGGVISPLDQNLKRIELQHLFKLFVPKFVICEMCMYEEIRASIKAANVNAKVIIIDSQDSSSEFYNWNDMRTEVDVDNYVPRKVNNPKTDLALILCSSGSTGLPKGIGLSHYALLFNNLTILNLPDVDLIKSVMITSPMFHISGIVLLMITATCGQTCVIPKSSKPEDILDSIQKYKPFYWMGTPAVIYHVVIHPHFKKYDVESVKIITSGGAALGRETGKKIKELWKGVAFFQGYGMTEVCGAITSSSPDQDVESVGKVGEEVKIKMVDIKTGESLGPNQIGECRIKTRRIMNGYYNNEEATKATFDENGWLRTGDLAYYNEEGFIYIVGRIKEAITYRSYQISPTELESFIINLPGVQDVAIIPIPHEEDDCHIRALVVKQTGATITAEDIIQSVKDNFTDFKHLRGGVQFVDTLHRSELGKLKRGHLMHYSHK